MFDIKAVLAEAEKEIAEERGQKAKKALKDKLRALDVARGVVLNIEREIADLTASIADGSF